MEKENNLAFEIAFIIGGCLVFYFSHSSNFFESLGGLVATALGSLLFAYLPHSVLKDKVHNSLLKSFSVVFLIINVLVWMAS